MDYRILRPLKNNLTFNRKIYAFDIETWQEDIDDKDLSYTKQNFLCGSVVGDGGIKFFTREKEELQDFLLSKKLEDSYIYATNLEFDFIHTFEYSKYFPNFSLIDRNGIIYAKHTNKRRHIHNFLDTWNYTGRMSVENMGKFLGIKKLDYPSSFKNIPKDAAQWEEMKKYNINDSYITYKFAEFYCRDFCQKIGAMPKITLASTGLDLWRRRFLDRDIFQESRDTITMHYQGSIHGGRTECIIRGKIDKKFECYDYNSHYPARCFYGIDGKGAYPLPSSSHRLDHITPNIIDSYEGITRCRLKAPYMHLPLLGINDIEGKYIFPTGIIEGWFTNIEIRKAIDNGYQLLECFEGVYYHALFSPFREAIKFLYSLRKKYKEEGNELMSMMTKTLMNAGMFGKFAQKIDTRSEIIHESRIKIEENGMLGVLNEFDEIIYYDTYNQKGDIFICSKKGELHIPIFIMPILSSYTTALGRIKLWDNTHKLGKNLIYMDTDSIMVMNKHLEDSNDLGELKLEYKANFGIFVKPKFYYVDTENNIKIKVKGLGKKPNDAMFNNILEGQRIIYEKFSRFKESRTRKIPFSSIIETHKDFSLEDTKRQWIKNFDPHAMEISGPLNITG